MLPDCAKVDNGGGIDLLAFATFSIASTSHPRSALSMTATLWRSRAITPLSRPVIAAILVTLTVALSGLLAVPAAAASSLAPPAGATDVGAFAEPIDWTQVHWFVNHQGDGFPLRVGQHDDGPRDGFGERHIIDGHGAVPDYEDIQEAVVEPGACWYTFLDERWRCHSAESLVFVAYSTQVDDRSGDGEPFGIITAYYMLPPATCGPTAAVTITADCQTEPLATSIDYRGPDRAVNGESLELAARLGDDLGIPKTGQPLTFSLGSGDHRQSCEAETSSAGVATCTIEQVNQPVAANVPLTIDYAGNTVLQPSSTTVDLALQTPTKVAFTGPEFIANGESATLTAQLTDFQDRPVAGRSVALSLGEGSDAQSCTGTTNATGDASCTIAAVDQPLNATATVPAAAVFNGDAAFLGSDDAATVKLEYYTGRAYGAEATVDLVVLPVTVPAQPDTGGVRTAQATSTDVPCTVAITAVVISADSLCADVTTTLAPGAVTATATVEEASIGLPGVPVIGVSGLTATATATCEAVSGATSLTLTVGGATVPVPTAPNTVIDVAAGVQLTVNEQVTSADGIAVTGVRVSVPETGTEIVLGYSTAAVHQCAP
jgi:hypothetical protein